MELLRVLLKYIDNFDTVWTSDPMYRTLLALPEIRVENDSAGVPEEVQSALLFDSLICQALTHKWQ